MRWCAMVCDASKSSKSQENGPFHRSVWLGLKARPIGLATRCDEIGHFAAILGVLGASQPIAAHRRSLLIHRSSVASQLPTMEYFSFLLRFSSDDGI